MSPTKTVWPDKLFIDIDRTGPIPLYFQVSQRLEVAIRDGSIPPGSRLENELSIASRLNVSRPTIRRAIQELVDKGLLVRRRGVGTQVVQGQVTRPVELTSLYEDLQGSQHAPSTRVLDYGVRAAPERTADTLGIREGSEVFYTRRLRFTDGVAVAILENYLPAAFRDITASDLENQGLYQILRSRGVTFRIANQRIGARLAQGDEAELLEIERAGPLLTMDRTAYDADGRAIEHGHHCYRPDLYSFETTLVAK